MLRGSAVGLTLQSIYPKPDPINRLGPCHTSCLAEIIKSHKAVLLPGGRARQGCPEAQHACKPEVQAVPEPGKEVEPAGW